MTVGFAKVSLDGRGIKGEGETRQNLPPVPSYLDCTRHSRLCGNPQGGAIRQNQDLQDWEDGSKI